MSRARLDEDILTPREWQVLELLREGKSTRDIAVKLGVPRADVEAHLNELGVPLRTSSRSTLATVLPSMDTAARESFLRLGAVVFMGCFILALLLIGLLLGDLLHYNKL